MHAKLTPNSHYSLPGLEHGTAQNKSPCRTRPSMALQKEMAWHGLARAGIQCECFLGWSTRSNLLLSTTQRVFFHILQGDYNILQGQLQGTSCLQFTVDDIDFCKKH